MANTKGCTYPNCFECQLADCVCDSPKIEEPVKTSREKRLESNRRYKQSEKGRANNRRYRNTPERKEYDRQYNAKYYAEHREELKAQMRAYRHTEEYKDKSREYDRRAKEKRMNDPLEMQKYKERKKAYAESHREQINAYKREYYYRKKDEKRRKLEREKELVKTSYKSHDYEMSRYNSHCKTEGRGRRLNTSYAQMVREEKPYEIKAITTKRKAVMKDG